MPVPRACRHRPDDASHAPSRDLGASTPAQNASGLIERIIADVPTSRVEAAAGCRTVWPRSIAREAARNAALVSASLALPPGPLGMLTVLPDLFLIWKIQRQLVADIFALHGRTVELTRTHMLYCLFRHMASQVLRDVVVRAGERAIVRQLSSHALTSTLQSLGLTVVQRLAGTSVSRWVPLAGAAAVGAYAYWDTLQVARTARNVLATTTPAHATRSARGERFDARRLIMCGRYELHSHPAAIALAFGLVAAAGAAAALQHRPDDGRADRPRQRRGTPRARSRCAGASCRAGRRTRRSARA